MLRKTYTLITILSAHVIHFFAYLFPKSNNVWVCIGWHNSKEREVFADNSKYFFLYLQNEKPQITSIWLAKDKKLADILRQNGYKAHYYNSILGIYYALRAGYTIVDAHIGTSNWKFSSRSKVVQLWHGKGMKKSGVVGNYNSEHSYFISPNYSTKYHSIVATSEKTGELLSEAFDQPTGDIIITGQPRTDVFFRDIKGSEIDVNISLKKHIEDARKKDIKKIILYAPTFRADGSNPLDQLDKNKLTRLDSFLKENNKLLIIGLHPKFFLRNNDITSDYSNIVSIQPGLDSYPYFKDIDIVITDYSNIYIDFLLVDKQTIFYTYDEDYYRKSTGLLDDFETLTPGPHVTDFDELLVALAKDDEYKAERAKVKEILFSQQDGLASERIFNELTK